MPPSNEATAAPPARWAAWLHALWGVRAGVAWQPASGASLPQQRPALARAGDEAATLHLPRGLQERTALAAAAHAAAHWRFGGAPQRRAGLKPVQQALFETLEDARVEWLALRELPGLRALWLPLHAGAEAPAGSGFEALLARLARELLAPAPTDPHPWIARARAAFFGADGRTLALDTPAAVRAAASRLGNDVGQMRLPFAPRAWRPHAAYRDDGAWLWEPEPVAPQVRDAAPAQPVSTPPAASPEASAAPVTPPVPYPEWDARIGRYRRDWCRVHVLEAPPAAAAPPDAAAAALRRSLQRALRQGRGSVPRHDGRSATGEVFHPMALLDARLQRLAGDTPDPRVYRRLAWPQPPLAVQLLLDASASSGDRAASGRTVLDELLALGLACAAALEAAGHRSALSSFCSRTRERVELRALKRWDEPADSAPVRARCAGQRSGGSTRTGAAVRHAAADAAGFAARAGLRPLVLVLTDGDVHDVDVPDPAYLLADLRRAVREAQGRGTAVACLQWGGARTATLPWRCARLRTPGALATALLPLLAA